MDGVEKMQNRYVTWLGLLAVAFIGLAAIGLLAGGAVAPSAQALLSPAAIIGVVCGVLWLTVKALLADRR